MCTAERTYMADILQITEKFTDQHEQLVLLRKVLFSEKMQEITQKSRHADGQCDSKDWWRDWQGSSAVYSTVETHGKAAHVSS